MKERIDHSNYEAWLLDRLEGNLGHEQDRALTAFLALHPELDPGPAELPALEGPEDRLDNAQREALKRTLPPVGMPGEAPMEDLLIAALEGDLSAEQRAALEVHLSTHPEHAREARLLAFARIEREATPFPQRGQLSRALPPVGTVNALTLDDHLVARLEGDLDQTQEEALGNYLAQHPEAQWQWGLMQHARVLSTGEAYPGRDALKRGGHVVPLFPRWTVRLAAAAMVALVFGVGVWTVWGPARIPGVNVAVAPATVAPAPGAGPARTDAFEADATTAAAAAERSAMNPVDIARPVPVKASQAPAASPVEVRSPRPMDLPTAPLQDLAQEPLPEQEPIDPTPTEEPAPVLAVAPTAEPTRPAMTAARPGGTTMIGALARTLRARVLQQPMPDDGPLDGDDALAAADIGLRAVSGEKAGLSVERGDDGNVRAFNVRLGPGLSIRSGR